MQVNDWANEANAILSEFESSKLFAEMQPLFDVPDNVDVCLGVNICSRNIGVRFSWADCYTEEDRPKVIATLGNQAAKFHRWLCEHGVDSTLFFAGPDLPAVQFRLPDDCSTIRRLAA